MLYNDPLQIQAPALATQLDLQQALDDVCVMLRLITSRARENSSPTIITQLRIKLRSELPGLLSQLYGECHDQARETDKASAECLLDAKQKAEQQQRSPIFSSIDTSNQRSRRDSSGGDGDRINIKEELGLRDEDKEVDRGDNKNVVNDNAVNGNVVNDNGINLPDDAHDEGEEHLNGNQEVKCEQVEDEQAVGSLVNPETTNAGEMCVAISNFAKSNQLD